MSANVAGVANALAFAKTIRAGRFHHVSSIAAAGLYDGVFREDMFEEARGLKHPYYDSKHKGEGLVRAETAIPWRIYRPGIVVGDSKTGEIDKIDGPYYFFKLIQKLRDALPSWVPMIGIEGGRINLVPVDFVVAAIDHLAHLDGLDGRAFHLTDPNPMRVGDMLDVLAKAAHGPAFTVKINASLFGLAPRALTRGLMALTPVRRMQKMMMKELRLPDDIFMFVNYPTRFDSRETHALLRPAGITVPAVRGLRLAALGLLGAPSRSGPVCRPFSARRGRGQARPRDGRLGRHRQGDRGQARPSRREDADRGARPGQARSRAPGIHGPGPRGRDLQRRHFRPDAMRSVHSSGS